jgi:hypothetical protein
MASRRGGGEDDEDEEEEEEEKAGREPSLLLQRRLIANSTRVGDDRREGRVTKPAVLTSRCILSVLCLTKISEHHLAVLGT